MDLAFCSNLDFSQTNVWESWEMTMIGGRMSNGMTWLEKRKNKKKKEKTTKLFEIGKQRGKE